MNSNTLTVTNRSIRFTLTAFKIQMVKEFQEGKGTSRIFVEYWSDLEVIGKEKAMTASTRWQKSYRLNGEDDFIEVPREMQYCPLFCEKLFS